MKCTLKVIVLSIFSLFISYSSMACDEGISAKDLRQVRMYSGGDNPDIMRLQHQGRMLSTLNEIEEASRKFHAANANKNFIKEKLILPKQFHRPHVLAFAEEIGFAATDDIETRRNKYIRLALSLRDMYRTDNLISEKLDLLSPKNRVSANDITNLVVQSFDQAILYSLVMERDIPMSRAIDFHMSFAELLLWRLHYAEHASDSLWDFQIRGSKVMFSPMGKRMQKAAIDHLIEVQKLLQNPSADLPVVYHRDIYEMAKSLTANQKFELYKMHKGEILEAKKALDELQIALNGSEEEAFPDDFVPTEAEKYFTQDVLQRFLLKQGIVAREALAKIILDKVHALAKSIYRIQFKNESTETSGY